MKRILIDLCFTADVSSPHSAKKVAFEQLYETAEGLSLRAQKDQLLYNNLYNLAVIFAALAFLFRLFLYLFN